MSLVQFFAASHTSLDTSAGAQDSNPYLKPSCTHNPALIILPQQRPGLVTIDPANREQKPQKLGPNKPVFQWQKVITTVFHLQCSSERQSLGVSHRRPCWHWFGRILLCPLPHPVVKLYSLPNEPSTVSNRAVNYSTEKTSPRFWLLWKNALRGQGLAWFGPTAPSLYVCLVFPHGSGCLCLLCILDYSQMSSL